MFILVAALSLRPFFSDLSAVSCSDPPSLVPLPLGFPLCLRLSSFPSLMKRYCSFEETSFLPLYVYPALLHSFPLVIVGPMPSFPVSFSSFFFFALSCPSLQRFSPCYFFAQLPPPPAPLRYPPLCFDYLVGLRPGKKNLFRHSGSNTAVK